MGRNESAGRARAWVRSQGEALLRYGQFIFWTLFNVVLGLWMIANAGREFAQGELAWGVYFGVLATAAGGMAGYWSSRWRNEVYHHRMRLRIAAMEQRMEPHPPRQQTRSTPTINFRR